MKPISTSLQFYINLSMAQAAVARLFDNRLSLHSIGLNDFIILYLLNEAPQQKLRRIDLAQKTGLSASGITRKLLPLEKIGMVEKEADARDARVSFVKLAKGGKRVLEDALASAEMAATELLPAEHEPKLAKMMDTLIQLGGSVR